MAHSNESSDDENNLHINDSGSKPKGSPKDEHSSDEEEQVLYKFETAQVVSQWIQDQQNTQFIIIDVRSNDYNPSKLKRSINIPHDKLKEKRIIENLIKDKKDFKNVVFHCAQGGSFSRNSAQYYAQYRQKHYQNYPSQNIVVLEGGYNNFSKNFPNLLEPVNANNTFKDDDDNNKSDNPFDDAFGENVFDNNDPFANTSNNKNNNNNNNNVFGNNDAFSNDFNGFDDFDFGNNKNQNANNTQNKDKKTNNNNNDLFGDFESE